MDRMQLKWTIFSLNQFTAKFLGFFVYLAFFPRASEMPDTLFIQAKLLKHWRKFKNECLCVIFCTALSHQWLADTLWQQQMSMHLSTPRTWSASMLRSTRLSAINYCVPSGLHSQTIIQSGFSAITTFFIFSTCYVGRWLANFPCPALDLQLIGDH